MDIPLGVKYKANGKVFTLEERDRLVIVVQGKQVQLGYNHSRAWNAMMEEARNIGK